MSAVIRRIVCFLKSALSYAGMAMTLGSLMTLLGVSCASAAVSLEVSGFRSDADDIQAVYVEATTGQFRLNFGTGGPGVSETVDISATATAPEVEDALNALSNVTNPGGVPGGSVNVTKASVLEGGVNRPYLVAFSGGPLGMRMQPLMTAKQGATPLGLSPLGGPATAYVATRVPGGISQSDERIDYTIAIQNTTAPATEASVGDVLFCNGIEEPRGSNLPKNWTPNGFEPTEYEFEWRRNGSRIVGESRQSYVVDAADVGAAIQCLVKGANATAASKWASLPAAQVSPPPSPLPPRPVEAGVAASRPTVSGTGTAMRTCGNPSNWTAGGSPVDVTHQWLRNGEEIEGAAAATYTPSLSAVGTATWLSGTNQVTVVSTTSGAFAVGQRVSGAGIPTGTTIVGASGSTLTLSAPTTAAGTSAAFIGGADAGVVLQCMAIGTTGTGSAPEGGRLVATSAVSAVGTVPSPPVMAATDVGTPDSQINGATDLALEMELPGPGSFVQSVSGAGWTCETNPAIGVQSPIAECTRSGMLSAQTGLSLTLGIGLGSDLPSTANVHAKVSAFGASVPAIANSSFLVEPTRLFGVIPGRLSARALDAEGEDFTRAGGHPLMAIANVPFARKHGLAAEGPSSKMQPLEPVRNIKTDVPPGFIGNPLAVPELCPSTEAMLANPPSCPPGSVVGELAIQSPVLGNADGATFKRMALFAVKPEAGVPAQFAAVESFNGGVYVVTPRLRPSEGYAIGIDSIGVPQNPLPLLGARVTLCSYGAIVAESGTGFRGCLMQDAPGAYSKPFLTTQTECAAPNPVTKFHFDSWANPGVEASATALAPKMTGCDVIPFEPELALRPTGKQAESASGLDVELTVPTDGFEDPDGLTQAHLKKTKVTLPVGMTVNPSSADGLEACTQAQLGMVNGVPNNDPVKCPNASKVGTAVVKTPILEEALEGAVYLAKQGDNPFGSLVALYLVVESKERGILIKLPGRVEFLPNGQVVSTFDDNPQAPISSLELSFFSGPRASLMTPQRCGSYDIVSELTPWSAADPDNPTPAETEVQTSTFEVTSGPGGGPCPTGALQPTMRTGIDTPIAGASSPFVLNLSREDGTQRMNGLTVKMPPGLAANLRGVPYCSEAALAAIPSALGTGAAEIASPSCPAASRIGSVAVAAGAGSPIWVNTGSAYLAGPYKGAPLSIAVVVPAVAGPFDLGNVVVRNAAFVDPRTAQVTIVSDPLPTHLHNLTVDARQVRVKVDRPGFMQAPTNCEPMRIDAVVSGEEGGSAALSSRFQVGECGSLDFAPKLKLEYKGQTKKSGNPALRAVLTQPGGEANIADTVVLLPQGSFIDNEHISNPCTRAQFAAGACPKSSILGYARAWSPLLDEPLQGPVYFRSNGGERNLPDVVAVLSGQVTVELIGYVDAVENKRNGTSRVRNTFAIVPDAPVSRFELNMKGGKVGLIENSRNLCKGKNKATVKMRAHNGLVQQTTPIVQTSCGKKGKNNKGKKRVKR